MADVTYNTASFRSLVRTLKSLMEVGVATRNNRPLLVIMGYKERHVDERTLWEMAKAVGLDFVHVGERSGGGGSPVEIWACTVEQPLNPEYELAGSHPEEHN